MDGRFTSPIALTGEPLLAMRLSLRAGREGVGVKQAGIRINAVNAGALVPHLSYGLYDGDRRLAVGGVSQASSTALEVTFGIREPAWEDPQNWDVYVTPSASAPD